MAIVISQNAYAKEFIDEEYNIKFDYPDEWTIISDKKITEFGIDYDETIIVVIYPSSNSSEFNVFKITTYTNMPDLNFFEKTIRTKLLTNELWTNTITDVKRIDLTNDKQGVIISAIELITENNHIIFQNNGTGYEVSFSLPLELMTKYFDDVFSITKQIINNQK